METRALPLLSAPMFKLALFVFIVFYQTSCFAKHNNHQCPPSSCGNITNISYPFRLRTDPNECGDKRYILSCENDNTSTVLYLYSGKYYVQSINYSDYTIRVVDSNVVKGNCSSIPRYSLTPYNFSSQDPCLYYPYLNDLILLMECENPVYPSSWYVDTYPCNITAGSSTLSQSKRHSYIWVNSYGFRASDLNDACRIDLMVMTSPNIPYLQINISYLQIHNVMANGFELTWYFPSKGYWASIYYRYLQFLEDIFCLFGCCSVDASARWQWNCGKTKKYFRC